MNRKAANFLASKLVDLAEEYDLSFVAHSNGCDITMKTIALPAKKDIRTRAIVLIGSVTDPESLRRREADSIGNAGEGDRLLHGQ